MLICGPDGLTTLATLAAIRRGWLELGSDAWSILPCPKRLRAQEGSLMSDVRRSAQLQHEKGSLIRWVLACDPLVQRNVLLFEKLAHKLLGCSPVPLGPGW